MALAFVQGKVINATASPAVFPAFTSAVAVGDLIVLEAGGDGGQTGDVTAVSDSLGNTYTRVPSFDFANSGGTLNMDAWYSRATHAGSSNVVTVTFNAANENFNGVVQHFNGFVGTATLDQKHTSSNTTSTTVTSGASATTTQAAELVIGMGIHASTTTTWTLGAGYTNLTSSEVSARGVAMESKVVASTGAQTATFTLGATKVNMGAVLTFYDLSSVTTTQTTLGKSRITALTLQTQTGKSRITNTTLQTQQGVAHIRGTMDYTYGGYASLPTDTTDLTNSYTGTQITNVSTPGNSTDVQDLSNLTYRIHQFAVHYASQSQINVQWIGKIGQPASAANVVLQVYNQVTPGWETLGTDSTTGAGGSSTINGSVITNFSHYFDGSNYVYYRVYQ